jgi:hypothetical protein
LQSADRQGYEGDMSVGFGDGLFAVPVGALWEQ